MNKCDSASFHSLTQWAILLVANPSPEFQLTCDTYLDRYFVAKFRSMQALHPYAVSDGINCGSGILQLLSNTFKVFFQLHQPDSGVSPINQTVTSNNCSSSLPQPTWDWRRRRMGMFHRSILTRWQFWLGLDPGTSGRRICFIFNRTYLILCLVLHLK